MYGFLLQDWITIRGSNSPLVTSITQTEANWVSLQPYQDIAFWIEVRELTLSGTTLTMNLETAPMKDESLFLAMVAQGISTSSATPITPIPKVIAASATVPLARWVRWRLVQSGAAPSAPYDLTFRICAAANAVGTLG